MTGLRCDGAGGPSSLRPFCDRGSLASTLHEVRTGSVTDQELLAAAERAIEQHGLAEVTLEQIAIEAGVSRVTLHRRGLGKREIVERLTMAGIDDYREAIWPALTGEGTAVDRLEQALEALCTTAEKRLRLLVGIGSAGDAIFHEQEGDERLTRSPFTEPLERLLRDGLVDGTVRELDPAETATLLFNVVGWTYIHLRTGHGWSSERARRGSIDIALRGIASAAEVTPQPAIARRETA